MWHLSTFAYLSLSFVYVTDFADSSRVLDNSQTHKRMRAGGVQHRQLRLDAPQGTARTPAALPSRRPALGALHTLGGYRRLRALCPHICSLVRGVSRGFTGKFSSCEYRRYSDEENFPIRIPSTLSLCGMGRSITSFPDSATTAHTHTHTHTHTPREPHRRAHTGLRYVCLVAAIAG